MGKLKSIISVVGIMLLILAAVMGYLYDDTDAGINRMRKRRTGTSKSIFF